MQISRINLHMVIECVIFLLIFYYNFCSSHRVVDLRIFPTLQYILIYTHDSILYSTIGQELEQCSINVS